MIGSGLLHWFYIVSGELLEPHIKKLMEKLHVDRKAKRLSVYAENEGVFPCVRRFCVLPF